MKRGKTSMKNGLTCVQNQFARNQALDSYDLWRFLSDYRDIISWVSSMKSLICADELANNVTDVEALLDRQQVVQRKLMPVQKSSKLLALWLTLIPS